MDLSTNLNLWWNLWNPDYVSGFNALNKWANEYMPFPGEFFRQWVKEFYQQNRLVQGELRLGDRPVDLRRITCPVLAVGAKRGQHRAAGLRQAAHRRRGQHGPRVRRAPGRAHLAHRRARRLGALLAEGVVLARQASVGERRDRHGGTRQART